jgi:hypothetical protein
MYKTMARTLGNCGVTSHPWPHHVQVILNHLYREGLFDVADELADEAGLPEGVAKEAKDTFAQMHHHLDLVRLETCNRCGNDFSIASAPVDMTNRLPHASRISVGVLLCKHTRWLWGGGSL